MTDRATDGSRLAESASRRTRASDPYPGRSAPRLVTSSRAPEHDRPSRSPPGRWPAPPRHDRCRPQATQNDFATSRTIATAIWASTIPQHPRPDSWPEPARTSYPDQAEVLHDGERGVELPRPSHAGLILRAAARSAPADRPTGNDATELPPSRGQQARPPNHDAVSCRLPGQQAR